MIFAMPKSAIFTRPVFVEQQVLRLDVAMHDAVLVRVLQRLADRRHDGQRLLRREAPGLHRLPQIHAIHELHEQVVEPARLAEVVHGDDVRMAQRRERLGLAREALGELRIVLRSGARIFSATNRSSDFCRAL